MKLKLQSILMLDEVNRYIKQSNIRDHIALIQATSDVFDGRYTRNELRDLIKRKVIRIVWHDERDPEYNDGELCGHMWTVDLMPSALQHFWPERWNNGAGSVRKRPVPRARVRSRRVQVRNLRSGRTRCASHHGKKTVQR